MRLVFMADTHLFLEDLEVPPGDVLIHAGDMCRAGSLEELRQHAAYWNALPHPHKLVVPGNHDWCFLRAREAARAMLPDSVHLEDDGVTIAGVRFWGSPWQPAFGGWAYNLPRGAPLAEKWALIPEATDVLVTHGPPLGFGDRTRFALRQGKDGRSGCADLAARVRVVRPLIHAFGHIHEDGGSWAAEGTYFLNVTTRECERACTVVDLDPQTRRVVPVQVPPASRTL